MASPPAGRQRTNDLGRSSATLTTCPACSARSRNLRSGGRRWCCPDQRGRARPGRVPQRPGPDADTFSEPPYPSPPAGPTAVSTAASPPAGPAGQTAPAIPAQRAVGSAETGHDSQTPARPTATAAVSRDDRRRGNAACHQRRRVSRHTRYSAISPARKGSAQKIPIIMGICFSFGCVHVWNEGLHGPPLSRPIWAGGTDTFPYGFSAPP